MMKRRMAVGALVALCGVSSGLLAACSNGDGGGGGGEAERAKGTLSFPLVTHGPSGSEYRLRDAVFEVQDPYYWGGYGGEGGADPGPRSFLVSSEDYPDADSISVSAEQGYYTITLRPGWHMQKVEGDVLTEVESTLLTGDGQWVYVSPHSSSWVEFSFGIGGRELWLNGQLNIGVNVYEDPDQYYGGYGGYGYGGEPSYWEGGAGG